MAASETEDSDILWCINHDSFPFKKPLMETQVGINGTRMISNMCLLRWINIPPTCASLMLKMFCLCSITDDVKRRWTFLGPLCG